MRHSQRRALERREKEFLKGDDAESPRYRHAVLTGVREARDFGNLAGISLSLIVMAALKQQADFLAAAGSIIAVIGVLRFRTGYVKRVIRQNARHVSMLPSGVDDTIRSEAVIETALSRAESNGLFFAVIGTLVNGFSSIVGHYFGWMY